MNLDQVEKDGLSCVVLKWRGIWRSCCIELFKILSYFCDQEWKISVHKSLLMPGIKSILNDALSVPLEYMPKILNGKGSVSITEYSRVVFSKGVRINLNLSWISCSMAGVSIS